jgi:hypothetical protein
MEAKQTNLWRQEKEQAQLQPWTFGNYGKMDVT